MSPIIRNQVKLASVALAAGVAFAAFGARDAWAPNAHFIGQVVNHGIVGTTDTVSGKIAGLGNEETTTVTATADAKAIFACQNNGGNFPEDPKKQEEDQEVSNEVTQDPDNGKVLFSIPLGPITTTLSCPGNQEEVLACIQFANKLVSFETVAGQTGMKDANPSTASVILFPEFTAECQAFFMDP